MIISNDFSSSTSFELPSFSCNLIMPEFVGNAQVNPPLTNRGGIHIYQPLRLNPPLHTKEFEEQKLLPTKFSAIIDYLSFTCPVKSIQDVVRISKYDPDLKDPDAVQEFFLLLSRLIPGLESIERNQGLFGYKVSYSLYRDNQHAGLMAFEGNNDTCYVSLSGVGCAGVDMYKMRLLMEKLADCKITRVDFAYDDLDGMLSVRHWRRLSRSGAFHIVGAKPKTMFYDDEGCLTGCTLKVGSKKNGKEACIYEKGKQLGDPTSPWVRVEGRLTSVDREIPLDCVTFPAVYLSAMYPCFGYLSTVYERVAIVKKTARISFEKMTGHLSVSYGKMINAMVSIGMTAQEIVDSIIRTDGIPKRLLLPSSEEQLQVIAFDDWLGSSVSFDRYGMPC